LFDVVSAQDSPDAKPEKLWKPSGKRMFDPWKKFCGAKPCYDVLEVAKDATEEKIRKSYRKLAREWHPDKNPEKGAREKFQKIAKAYEILSTEGSRATYDNLMKTPAEYTKLYGNYWYKVAAPPSDVTFVILFLIAIVSGIHFMVLKQRMTEYNGKLIKFCVENFGPSQGGSNETLEIHKEALSRFNQGGKGLKTKALKTDPGFKLAVIDVLEEDNMLLPAPTVWDTVGFQVLKLPMTAPKSIMTNVMWFVRHTVQGQPYTDEEKQTMLENAVDEWADLSAKQQTDLMECEGWKDVNLQAWRKKSGKKIR